MILFADLFDSAADIVLNLVGCALFLGLILCIVWAFQKAGEFFRNRRRKS